MQKRPSLRSKIIALGPGESLLIRNKKCSCVRATTYAVKRDTGQVYTARKAGPMSIRVTRTDGMPSAK